MSVARPLRVAHVLPWMMIGGVETGVQRSLDALQHEFDYRVFHVRRAPGILDCGQRSIWHLLGGIVSGRWRPDLVVTSLSWAHPLGQLCQLLGIPWVAFFHSSGFSHARDEFSQRWAWRRADHCLADSEATRAAMATRGERPCRVVPYRFMESAEVPAWAHREIDMIWVGRNHPDKRLDLFLALLDAVMARQPCGRAVLVVAGDVDATLAARAAARGWRLDVICNAGNDQVRALLRQARFYILLSDYEGMSMSTIEAVMAGCVPVVRPVGEIPVYVPPDAGLHVEDVSEAALARVAVQLCQLWRDGEAAARMNRLALAGLAELPDYVSAFSAAIRAYSASTRSA